MIEKLKIAIHQNEKVYKHSNSWTHVWIDYCKKNELDYEVVDCYSLNILDKLKDFDVLLWHFGNYSHHDMLFARSILFSAKQLGLKVFPDFNTAWHFDDKIAEYYLLRSVNAPIPESWIFYTKQECIDWLRHSARYPIVAKLRSGSGSNNVKLIKSVSQGISYANRMFGKGYRNVPGLLFKAKSNIRSSRNWETFLKRYKRIPEFLKTQVNARKLPKEHGYAYFQEFIPNEGYDLKIAVIGDKLSYFARHVRKGDFRASGGADFYFDKSLVTPDIIKSAFETSQRLGFKCMGFDYVADNRNHRGKIIEISYGFSYAALLQAEGYWDVYGKWHNEPLNAPEEIIRNMLYIDIYETSFSR